MADPRKVRHGRAPGRSGRPLPNPLTCMLSHSETREFKAMVKRRGLNVNRVLAALARAELKTWEMAETRIEIDSAVPTNFHQLGQTPTVAHTVEKNRHKESQAENRLESHRSSLLDKPANMRA